MKVQRSFACSTQHSTVSCLMRRRSSTIIPNHFKRTLMNWIAGSMTLLTMAYTSLDLLLPNKLVRISNRVLLWLHSSSHRQLVDENNVYPLFESLDRIEKILSESDYLVKNTFTEADIRLFTTIVRYVIIILPSERETYPLFQIWSCVPWSFQVQHQVDWKGLSSHSSLDSSHLSNAWW